MATGFPYYTVESASGGFRAHLYGANDRLVWWTEVYTTKQHAIQAINFVQQNGGTTQVLDRS